MRKCSGTGSGTAKYEEATVDGSAKEWIHHHLCGISFLGKKGGTGVMIQTLRWVSIGEKGPIALKTA